MSQESPSSSAAARRAGRNLRAAIPTDGKPELLMPVTEHQAAELMGIEALRSINKALDKVAEKLEANTETLHGMDKRLTKMEANDALLQALVIKVDALERDKDRRDGAVGLVEWLSKVGPWGFAVVMALLAVLGWVERVNS